MRRNGTKNEQPTIPAENKENVAELIKIDKISNENAYSKLNLQKSRVMSHIFRVRRNQHKNKLQILGPIITNNGYSKDEIKRRIS